MYIQDVSLIGARRSGLHRPLKTGSFAHRYYACRACKPKHCMYTQRMTKVYYKIQVFNDISLTWIDVQKTFDTPENARTFGGGKKYRVIRIAGRDRTILPE